MERKTRLASRYCLLPEGLTRWRSMFLPTLLPVAWDYRGCQSPTVAYIARFFSEFCLIHREGSWLERAEINLMSRRRPGSNRVSPACEAETPPQGYHISLKFHLWREKTFVIYSPYHKLGSFFIYQNLVSSCVSTLAFFHFSKQNPPI